MKIKTEKWLEGPRIILIAENQAEQFQLMNLEKSLIGFRVPTDSKGELDFESLINLSFFAKGGVS